MTARRKFQDKLNNIQSWIDIFNHYWDQLKGEYYDHKPFWDNTLHAMTNDDWWDVVDCYERLYDDYESYFRSHGYIANDIDIIKRRLNKSQPVVKPDVRDYNRPAFHVMVVYKDVLNDINGTPTVDYSKKVVKEEPTHFQTLFEIVQQ